MEEWVGSVWHRFVTNKASTNFDSATVELKSLLKSVGMVFRALGGDPGKRIEAAAPRDYLTRRSFLQKVSGSYHQLSLAWQDEDSLRLPESIAVFPTEELNKELYLWLAALAAHQDMPFKNWAKDNQSLVVHILQKYPSLRTRYQQLVEALIAIRPPVSSLKKSEQALELAVLKALTEPGSVDSFPTSNYAPQAIYLWLYPSARVDHVSANENEKVEETESENKKQKQQHSEAARKKTERVDDPNVRNGMMVFRLENLFSWSEFTNVDRGKDDSEDEDSQRAAEDLDKMTLSKQQDNKTAKLKINLDLPSPEEDDIPIGEGIKLPEWQYKSKQLLPDRVLLQPMLPKGVSKQKLPHHLIHTAKKIRAQFEQLQNTRHWLRAQPQGEELDLTSWLDFHVESQFANTAERGVYQSFVSNHRDLSCLLLADISMSTDSHLNDNARVIDVVKDSMLLLGEALQAVGDSFAMYGFSSVKRHQVRFTMLKNFAERYDDNIRGRIQALTPGFYTRIGAAIRQATKVLSEQPQKQKLLLLITDGKPNDIDHYEGRFGIEDTHQAIKEAKQLGLQPFCITIDQKADEYLPYLFGSDGFTVILRPEQLPTRLPILYHQLTS